MYVELTFAELVIDPLNYRGRYEGIEALAESIELYGLLQNLIVKPPVDGRYTISAGNRRALAIQKLIHDGRWERTRPIMCLVTSAGAEALGDDVWIPLVENSQRHDVPVWRIGFRYLELQDLGFTTQQIADKLHITRGKVSNTITIARGLHPAIQEELEKLGHQTLAKNQLLMIARCMDDCGNPLLEPQQQLLRRFLNPERLKYGKRSVATQGARKVVFNRYTELLKGTVAIPPVYAPVVESLLRYLSGDDDELRIEPMPVGFQDVPCCQPVRALDSCMGGR